MSGIERLPKIILPGISPDRIVGPYGHYSKYVSAKDQIPTHIQECFDSLRSLTVSSQGWNQESYGPTPNLPFTKPHDQYVFADFILASDTPPIGETSRGFLRKPDKWLDIKAMFHPDTYRTLLRDERLQSYFNTIRSADLSPHFIGRYQHILAGQTGDELYALEKLTVRPFIVKVTSKEGPLELEDPRRVIFTLTLVDRRFVAQTAIDTLERATEVNIESKRSQLSSAQDLLSKLPSKVANLESEIEQLESAPPNPQILKNKEIIKKLQNVTPFSFTRDLPNNT